MILNRFAPVGQALQACFIFEVEEEQRNQDELAVAYSAVGNRFRYGELKDWLRSFQAAPAPVTVQAKSWPFFLLLSYGVQAIFCDPTGRYLANGFEFHVWLVIMLVYDVLTYGLRLFY